MDMDRLVPEPRTGGELAPQIGGESEPQICGMIAPQASGSRVTRLSMFPKPKPRGGSWIVLDSLDGTHYMDTLLSEAKAEAVEKAFEMSVELTAEGAQDTTHKEVTS